ncbi:MAG TPA: flagellar basal body-associated FliL family protein [Desulfomonilia bacterium]|nr:flagellar basal body-associated FliL family protein [Desulfomonilia bacterium]
MAGEEKGEKKEQVPEVKKKEFPVKIVVIALVAVLVVVSAVTGYFLVIGPKMKASGKEGSGKEVKHESTQSKSSGEGEGSGSSGPLKQLDPFIVNLSDAQGQRYLKAVMQLEVDNPTVEGEIQSKLPQIRDEILMILSSKSFDDVSTSAGKRMVKREIVSAVNKYITSGQVTQVYFTEFVVQ